MLIALEIVFWTSVGLIVWTQLGYGLALWIAASALRRTPRGKHAREAPAHPASPLPSVSLIIAAHDEAAVIESKVANAKQLHYPRDLLEVVIACDGCEDDTAQKARDASADLVLELPRGGKIKAQDAAVARSKAEIVAFSDANSLWRPDALRLLVGAFEDDTVGYACGQVRFTQAAGEQATNQEGLYWRYEMALRTCESRLASITAGNGAIYATRRVDYIVVDPAMGHDLSFPFNMVKRGRRAVYVPQALATEKMVPSIEGEQARKRRMMAHTWAIVLAGGMLSLRSYGLAYASMIVSHRLLRYLSPFLHLLALASNLALVAAGVGGTRGIVYAITLCLQLALLACAALGGTLRWRALLIVRYYVLTTASLAVGLWDWLRHGVSASWEAAEGTR